MHTVWGGTNNTGHESTVKQQVSEESVKFDISNTSDDVLKDGIWLWQVNETISKLESSLRSQSDIDGVYADWCNNLKDHMLKHLPRS